MNIIKAINKNGAAMKNILGLSTVMMFASLSLVGCGEMYAPGTITETHVQVQEDVINQDMALADVDSAYIAELARHYSKHGGSPMEMVVLYDPASYRNTAMMATHAIAEIKAELRGHDVKDVQASILPINALGDEARVLIGYTSVSAHAPKGCDQLMPGLNGDRVVESNERYKLGCSIETMIANQVSRPSDLLGNGVTPEVRDGRSLANIVSGYRSGAQNPSLQGQSASE